MEESPLEVGDFPWPGNHTAPPAPHFINTWMLGPLFIILITMGIAFIYWLLNKFCKSNSLPAAPRIAVEQTVHRKALTFDIEFDHLGLALKGSGAKVLNGVSGRIRSGCTTAVMGPSGSGKTTFLTTLAGRASYGTTTGAILLNGVEDSLVKYPKLVGFVPQEDVMHRDCSVEENLMYSARARLPATMTDEARMGLVDETIVMLGLHELRKSLIGDENKRGISGGQRKRVNVGIELVADPSVLFLDEPTSGLDSFSSKEICSCLQKLSRSGMTIVAVIHSPRYEIFNMFDDVLLLGKGGRTVYLGPSAEALSYFERLGFRCPPLVNAADFMMDGEVPREGHSTFHASDLFDIWNEQTRSRRPSFAAPGNAPKLDVVPVNNAEENEVLPLIRRAPLAKSFPLGTAWDFIRWTITTFLFCFLLPIAMYHGRTLRARYGALFGAQFAFFIGFLLGMSLLGGFMGPPGSGDSVQIAIIIMFCIYAALGFVTILFTVYQYLNRRSASIMSHLTAGFLLNIFYLPVVWPKQSLSVQERYAAVIGFGACFIMVAIPLGMFGIFLSVSHEGGFPLWLWGLLLGFLAFGATILIVLQHRYEKIPTADRPTPSAFAQMWRVFVRSVTQQLRFWPGLAFDLFLPIMSACFLGVVTYGKYWTPPLINYLPDPTCPSSLPQQLCIFLELPPGDPIPGRASLTTLSLALSAVASSVRVFGAEQVIWRREKEACLSTEAYYVGKSLGHLPTVILAPLLFTFFFYALVQPLSPFYQYFFLYLSVYFTCAGLAYCISILVPPNLAQLVGVLFVLIFMMFSGANPTLDELKHNPLLGRALFYPSFGSLFRWTQELYYLIEVGPYHPTVQTLAIYSYSFGDWRSCITGTALLAIIFRLAAYISIVKSEG